MEATTEEKDRRIKVELLRKEPGDECQGVFHFSNATGVFGFGGYTLELRPSITNAKAEWTPPGDPDGKAYLPPAPLDVDMRVVPLDASSGASVYVNGEMTVGSLVIDTSLFVLKAALELIPLPTGCLIQEDQLLWMALRNSYLVEPAVGLALKGDFRGARNELSLRMNEFLEQAQGYAAEAGLDCVAEALKAVLKKPVAVAKIVLAYLTWIPVVIFDYFKYSGLSADVSLVFTPEIPVLPPLNRREGSSILQWIQYALKYNDIAVFEALTADDGVVYANYTEGGQTKTKQEFMAELKLRLPNDPQCDGYINYSDYSELYDELHVWTSGWSPAWELTELCYEGCQALSPPWASKVASLQFEKTEDGWTLRALWLNDFSVWRGLDPYNAQLRSCDQPISPPEIGSTQVIVFYPTGVTGEELTGSCWTLSIASPRDGAWRCVSDNQIFDPCFSPQGETGYVICGALPLGDTRGFRLNLTEPLPVETPPSQLSSALAFELEDGTTCRFSTTGTLFEVEGKYFNYGCSDGSVLLEVNPGGVWTATKASLSSNRILETVQVNIRTVWK